MKDSGRGSAILLFHTLEMKGASMMFSFAQASSHFKAYTYSTFLSRSGTRTPKKREGNGKDEKIST